MRTVLARAIPALAVALVLALRAVVAEPVVYSAIGAGHQRRKRANHQRSDEV